jgi:hypothetical protein
VTSPLYSPDRRFFLQFEEEEMRMSHWLRCPILVETATGKVLFSLAGTLWSAEQVAWNADTLTLLLRRYPGDQPPVTVIIHLSTEQATLTGPSGTSTISLDQAKSWFKG